MKQLIVDSYPKDPSTRDRAYGPWKDHAAARTPEELFDIICKKQNCLKNLAKGFGAITLTTQESPHTATLSTTRGATFNLKKVEGEWGLATFCESLQKDKIRLQDNLAQIKRNAADYREQRLATGKE